MLVSLIAAVVAALCYGVASVMQAVAVREASNRTAAHEAAPGWTPACCRACCTSGASWRASSSTPSASSRSSIALQRLPLFAVQAMVAANLAVIAVLASLVIGVSLSWREWAAVTGVVAGVGLLGSSAGAEGAHQAGAVFKIALIVATAVLGVCGLIAARLRDPARTLLLGTIAGLGYGVLGVAARVLTGFEPLTLIRDPAAYAVVAGGIISFVFYTTALEGGSVTVATAAVVLAETLPPAVIGVHLPRRHDQARPGAGRGHRLRDRGGERARARPVRRGRAGTRPAIRPATAPAIRAGTRASRPPRAADRRKLRSYSGAAGTVIRP